MKKRNYVVSQRLSRVSLLKLDVIIDISDSSRFLTRNSSGDEIVNVNFLCDDIVHALKMQ